MSTVLIRRPDVVRAPVRSSTDSAGSSASSLPTSTSSLKGLRVGLRTEGNWQSWIYMIGRWSEMLVAGGAAPVVLLANGDRVGPGGDATKDQVRAWAESIDVGISGLGTCGSCTSYTVVDAITIADAGRPAAAAITEEFVPHARSIATHLGHAELPILTLPHPLEGRPEAELSEIALRFFPQLAAMLAVRP